MQNSAGKSIKLYQEAKKAPGTAPSGIIITAVVLIVILLSGCASLKDSRRTVPYGALPGDCLFYFALDPAIIPVEKVEKSIRPLFERTYEITGGGIRGEFYLLLRGRYPDAFAEKRISESPGWTEGNIRHSYNNRERNLSLFFAENNHIFATNYVNPVTGDNPLDKIYRNYRYIRDSGKNLKSSGITDNQAAGEYFLGWNRENLFQFFTVRGEEFVSLLDKKRLESAEVKELEVVLKDSGKKTYLLESSISFSDEKEASKYSPVIKLVMLDLTRKKDSGVSAADGRKFTVKKDRSIIKVSDIIVTEKLTGDIFDKIMKGQVF